MKIKDLLVCVGAQKAGTTWLHHNLKNSEDIYFPNVKEIHYFNTIHNNSILLARRRVENLERVLINNKSAFEKYFVDISVGNLPDVGIKNLLSPFNDDWYTNLFLGSKKKYAADFTPEYSLIGMEGYNHIKQVSERQKIIFIMRDPVDRALSAIRYFYKMKGIDIANESEKDILLTSKQNFIIKMSQYENTIKNLDFCFNKDQILYLFYEDIMIDKNKYLNIICQFLKIKNILNNNIDDIVNGTKDFKFSDRVVNEMFESTKSTYNFVRTRFRCSPSLWRA